MSKFTKACAGITLGVGLNLVVFGAVGALFWLVMALANAAPARTCAFGVIAGLIAVALGVSLTRTGDAVLYPKKEKSE